MTKLTNKFKIDDIEENRTKRLKRLPDSFMDTKDEISLGKSLFLSLILHPAFAFLVWVLILVAMFLNLKYDFFPKPKPKVQDIEFVLVDKEQTPINKKTPFRSDKNSRAGGKHDPTKKVSMPQPAAKKAAPSKPSPKPQPKKSFQPLKQMLNPTPEPQPKAAPKKTIAPPSAKPAPKPTPSKSNSNMPARPSLPKITANPNSPFQIATPKSDSPLGLSPSGGSNAGSSRGTSSASRGSSSGSPSPTLAPSRSGTGSSSSGASRGGYGSAGNPGPGNPKGSPGIDAIKEPNWGPYMRELERRIKRNWDPPKGNESKRVVLLFKIGRDGRLLSVKTVKSSGNQSADQAAKSAVELTAPFKSLPPEFKGSSIDIEFTFDYNVFGTSYR